MGSDRQKNICKWENGGHSEWYEYSLAYEYSLVTAGHVTQTDQSRFDIVDSRQNANSFKWQKLKYQGMTRLEIIIQTLNDYYKNF